MNTREHRQPALDGEPIHLYARRVVDLAMQAGDLMLRSGAETTRTEETVNMLIRGLGLARSDCLVTPTGIYLSVDDARLDRIAGVIEAHWPQAIAPDHLGDAGLIGQVEEAREALLRALELGELL